MKVLVAAVLGVLGPLALVAGLVLSGDPERVSAQELKGPVILTVTGEVTKPNRGAYDPETDKFFGHNELDFKAATGFDFEMLEKLERVRVKADFPRGEQVHEFEGPTLASVLEAAGATGDKITLMALDGYMIEMPVSELIRQGAVLALKRDGQPLGIGDFGPTQIVFPRAERPDLKDMTDDAWIWSIYHIKVE
ncbi:MAG TPA: hypothetical protein VFR34_07285 [Paracoccaceae bacterium]|nr:hypothetical protein [Paracoccaceae bacterium]